MIVNIFYIISKKQNLNQAVVDKLLTCLKDLKSFNAKFIDNRDRVYLARNILDEIISWTPSEPNIIEKTIVDSINSIRKEFFSSLNEEYIGIIDYYYEKALEDNANIKYL